MLLGSSHIVCITKDMFNGLNIYCCYTVPAQHLRATGSDLLYRSRSWSNLSDVWSFWMKKREYIYIYYSRRWCCPLELTEEPVRWTSAHRNTGRGGIRFYSSEGSMTCPAVTQFHTNFHNSTSLLQICQNKCKGHRKEQKRKGALFLRIEHCWR